MATTKKPENKMDFKEEIGIIKEDIDYLYSDNCDNMNRCSSLEEDIEELQEDVECLDECIDTIDDTLEGLRKQIKGHEQRLDWHSEWIAEINRNTTPSDWTTGISIVSMILSIAAMVISIIAMS